MVNAMYHNRTQEAETALGYIRDVLNCFIDDGAKPERLSELVGWIDEFTAYYPQGLDELDDLSAYLPPRLTFSGERVA